MELRRLVVLSTLSIGVIGLTACDGEGLPSLTRPDATDPGTPEPTDAPVATEAPTPTDAPVATEAPTPTDAPVVTEAPEEGDDDGTPAWLIPAIVGGAALLVLMVVLAARRQSRGDTASAGTGAAGDGGRRQAHAMAAWIHDQLTLEILALPATDAARRWATERARLDQLAIDARVFASAGDAELWNQLVVILQQLGSSIDTAVRLRTTEGADPQMTDEAVAIANRHRAELGTWVAQARPFV